MYFGSSKKSEEDTQPVIKKCKYAHKVRVISLPYSSMNEDQLRANIRRAISFDARFARAWPRCPITGKEIPLTYEKNKTFEMIGYFHCPNCKSENLTSWG